LFVNFLFHVAVFVRRLVFQSYVGVRKFIFSLVCVLFVNCSFKSYVFVRHFFFSLVCFFCSSFICALSCFFVRQLLCSLSCFCSSICVHVIVFVRQLFFSRVRVCSSIISISLGCCCSSILRFQFAVFYLHCVFFQLNVCVRQFSFFNHMFLFVILFFTWLFLFVNILFYLTGFVCHFFFHSYVLLFKYFWSLCCYCSSIFFFT